ncbi:unnamed protein product, partial [Meganyctiphanes norvegica]
MPSASQASQGPGPSQDLDPRFAVFLNPIRDLTKNWEVDIAKYMEEYLEELAEVQITFDGGETMMNFAEAAMLIQGSATVYSKKVEFLWQMVLQMLDLLSSRRTAAANTAPGAEGQEQGGKGGKGHVDLASADFVKMDHVEEGRNIDMKDDDDEGDDEDGTGGDTKKKLKFLPSTPLHLVDKEGEKSVHRVELIMKNHETFGAKDDFRLCRSYLTPIGMLFLDVPKAALFGGNNVAFSDVSQALQCNRGSYIAPAEADPAAQLPPPEQDDLGGVDIDPGFDEGPPPAEMEVDEAVAPVEEQEKNENNDSNKENKEDHTVIVLPCGRSGLRKRGDKRPQETIATMKLTDPWAALDPHQEAPVRRPVRQGRIRRPLPCLCHRPQVERKSRTKKKKDNKEIDKKDLPSVEEFITKDLTKMINKSNCKVPPELLEEANKEVAKRLEATKKRRVRDAAKAGHDDPETTVTEQEEREKLLQRMEDDGAVMADDMMGGVDMDDHYDELPAPPLFLPDPHNGTLMPNGGQASSEIQQRLNDSQMYEASNEYEALVQRWVADYVTNAQEHINSSELTRRVNRWKTAIGPKLELEEQRKDFDIHGYGSDVLSNFPDDGRKTTVTFGTVAKNLPHNEVPRIFLSCLMLANTYNIDITESTPGDYAMDCMELTLLSRVRHHEVMEEYAAPSQDSPPKRKKATSGGKKKGSSDIPCGSPLGSLSPPGSPLSEVSDMSIHLNTDKRPKAKSKHKKKKN